MGQRAKGERDASTNLPIPNTQVWEGQTYDEVYFNLTQLLTGHGYFRGYLFRFHWTEDLACVHCSPGEEDENSFLGLPSVRRRDDTSLHATLQYEKIVLGMLSSNEKSKAVVAFANEVIKKRRLQVRREWRSRMMPEG